jgi:outer membrane immunogenic protein
MARNNVKLLLALAPLGVAFAGHAWGADVALRAPNLAPLPYSWTGFYVGANLGYGVGQGPGAMTHGGVGGPGIYMFNAQPAGVLVGGQAGYNYQIGSIVLGVETDIQGSAASDDATCLLSCLPGTSAVLYQKQTWFGTTRGRLGWATGPVMTYLTGGVAYGGTESNLWVAAGGANGALNVTSTATGWTWGSGVEAALDGNWTAKAEYLYINLGSAGGAVAVAGVPVGFITKNQEQIFRGGVNYKVGGNGAAATMPSPTFNWAGPYVGADFGYALNRDPGAFAVPGAIAGVGGPSIESFNLSPRGFLGGGLIGYNWQMGRWVAGVDADLQKEIGSGYVVCSFLCGATAAALIDQKMSWFGTVRGRLGYATGPTLFYATAGLAYGKVKDTVNEKFIGVPAGAFAFEHINTGSAVGAGIENTFDLFGWFGRNWTTRTEYLYVDLGNASDRFGYAAAANQALSSSIHSHIWRSALIYKVGDVPMTRW